MVNKVYCDFTEYLLNYNVVNSFQEGEMSVGNLGSSLSLLAVTTLELSKAKKRNTCFLFTSLLQFLVNPFREGMQPVLLNKQYLFRYMFSRKSDCYTNDMKQFNEYQ